MVNKENLMTLFYLPPSWISSTHSTSQGLFSCLLRGKDRVYLKATPPKGCHLTPVLKQSKAVIGEGKIHRPPSSPFRKAGLSHNTTPAPHASALLPASSEQGHKAGIKRPRRLISDWAASLVMHLFHYPHTFLCFGSLFCFSGVLVAVSGGRGSCSILDIP